MSGAAAGLPVGELAGELVAVPGDAREPLRSSRREWAPLLARGRPATALPSLLSAAYSLCGGAHALAAAAAVGAARDGQAALPTPAQRESLRADTLREHLRRIALDWPRVQPWPGGAAAVSWLAGSPAMREAADADATRAWIEHELLGQPAGDWLAQHDAAPLAFVEAWACEGRTPVARWLHAAAARLDGLAVPLRALPAPTDADDVQALAGALRGDPAFALRPTWRGAAAETGPWTRGAARTVGDAGGPRACPPAGETRHPAGVREGAAAAPQPLSLFARLAARVAEIVRLASPGGEAWLAMGAAAVGPSEGLAWCEMARGLLVHGVRLAPGGVASGPTVETARVLAPTEWNFHPQGAFAQVLAGLPADAPRPLVELAAAAFDPCVTLQVAGAAGVEEAACTR